MTLFPNRYEEECDEHIRMITEMYESHIKGLLAQSRRVRNYSNPDEVYYAVPVKFIESMDETIS